MSKESEITQWVCECSENNPLHLRKCRRCEAAIPRDILKQVYQEELAGLKEVFHLESIQRKINKWKNAGIWMCKMQKALLPIFLILVLALNMVRYYINPGDFTNGTSRYREKRIERFLIDYENAYDNFSGLKDIPRTIHIVNKSVQDSIYDVSMGLSINQKKLSQDTNGEKIRKVQNKINIFIEQVDEVINYVTRKLK